MSQVNDCFPSVKLNKNYVKSFETCSKIDEIRLDIVNHHHNTTSVVVSIHC